MATSKLTNCKKCGTLFFKTSGRDICNDCYKKETYMVEKIKDFVTSSQKELVTINEIADQIENCNASDIEDFIIKGRLFAVLPKISVKCRFCGAEVENDKKSGFICKKCLGKFSPQFNETGLGRKNTTSKYEEEARTLNRRLRGGMFGTTSTNRYGFIQNYDL